MKKLTLQYTAVLSIFLDLPEMFSDFKRKRVPSKNKKTIISKPFSKLKIIVVWKLHTLLLK